MTTTKGTLRIKAIDCCEHVLLTLKAVRGAQLLANASSEAKELSKESDVDLIVIGIARYPVRRFFISHLRRLYPSLPILILRREQIYPGAAEERVRAEFVLSDEDHGNDGEIVQALRQVMPFQSCEHLQRGEDYDAVRELIILLSRAYTDPSLDLAKIARQMPISPKRLSVMLNRRVGVSFRQLLRQVRIEEAKRMLATRQYSVKEVAARVGFTDSHYFSRSFKEFTGQSASDYQEKSAVLN